MSGFSAWAYWKVLSQPAVFGNPTFDPDSFSATRSPPISEPPAWFQEQFGAERPEYPQADVPHVAAAATPSAKDSVSQAPSGTRPSTRSSKAKEGAASPAPPSSMLSTTVAASSTRTSRGRPAKIAAIAPAVEPSPSAVTARTPSAKARGKQRAASGSRTDGVENIPVGADSSAQHGSSLTPIDVDAMDVDTNMPSKVLRGRPIELGRLRYSTTMRGREAPRDPADERDVSGSPVRRPESPTEGREATVPPVEGLFPMPVFALTPLMSL